MMLVKSMARFGTLLLWHGQLFSDHQRDFKMPSSYGRQQRSSTMGYPPSFSTSISAIPNGGFFDPTLLIPPLAKTDPVALLGSQASCWSWLCGKVRYSEQESRPRRIAD